MTDEQQIPTSLKYQYSDAKCIPAVSDQDVVRIGSTDQTWFGIVADGHGGGRITESLRKIDNWSSICLGFEPIRALQDRVRSMPNTFRDGSTVAMARVVKGRFEAHWLGDSRIMLFADGKLLWQSTDHSSLNSEEVAMVERWGGRLATSGSYTLKVLSPDRLTMIPSPVFELGQRFRDDGTIEVDCTNISRCLGHDHNDGKGPRTPQEASSWSYSLVPGVDYKIVIASDGLWDVFGECDLELLGNPSWTAARLADMARERWKKTWTYCHPDGQGGLSGSTSRESMREKDADDISVAVWTGSVSPNS